MLIEEQQKASKLQSEVDRLQEELVNTQLRLKTWKRGSKLGPVSDTEAIQNALIRWAKFFCIFYFPGVTADDFANKKPDFEHDDPSRYEDDNAHLGTTAKLYAVLPENYMSYLVKHDGVIVEVCNSPLSF